MNGLCGEKQVNACVVYVFICICACAHIGVDLHGRFRACLRRREGASLSRPNLRVGSYVLVRVWQWCKMVCNE